jgi:acyl carrier protein
MFIEERFGIEFMSSEIDRSTFRSVAQIEKTIRNKLEQKS